MKLVLIAFAGFIGSQTHAAIDASMAAVKGEPVGALNAGLGAPDYEQIFDSRQSYVWERGGCRFRVIVDAQDRIDSWETRGRTACRGLSENLRLLVDGRKG